MADLRGPSRDESPAEGVTLVVDFKMEGAGQLADLAKRCKQVGDKEITKELYSGLNRAVKPVKDDIKRAMPDHLPDRYAAELARSLRVQTRRRTGRRNPALYIVGKAKTKRGAERDLASLNRGRLRHPLFGMRGRGHWFDQRVRPDWWDHPILRGERQIQAELMRTMDSVLRKLER